MTKEELVKEAKDVVYGMGYDTYDSDGHSDFAVQDILVKFAEPREKRIAELEEENAELKSQIDKMKCCENCAWWYKLPNGQRDCAETCENRDNWSLRR